jgi:hypothetical protein
MEVSLEGLFQFVMPRLGLGIHEFVDAAQGTRGSQGQALG